MSTAPIKIGNYFNENENGDKTYSTNTQEILNKVKTGLGEYFDEESEIDLKLIVAESFPKLQTLISIPEFTMDYYKKFQQRFKYEHLFENFHRLTQEQKFRILKQLKIPEDLIKKANSSGVNKAIRSNPNLETPNWKRLKTDNAQRFFPIVNNNSTPPSLNTSKSGPGMSN